MSVILFACGRGKLTIQAAVYPPLVLLTRTIRLGDAPFLAILTALLNPNTDAAPSQRLLTLMVLLEDRKEWTGGLGENALDKIMQIERVSEYLLLAVQQYTFENALRPLLGVLLEQYVFRLTSYLKTADSAGLLSPYSFYNLWHLCRAFLLPQWSISPTSS
jgi:U3 small nucleolar RNA-associated protein 10